MAKKKSDPNETVAPSRAIIRAKTPMDWSGLLQKAAEQAWRRLRVEIQVRERLLAGKPASLDAATAMLKARGLEDFVATAEDVTDPAERADMAATVEQYEGLCEFVRRPGKDGCWIPSNNVKAGLKENWSVLGLRVAVRGSRGALAEGLFVAGVGMPEDTDWIYVGPVPSGIETTIAHTMSAKGPVSSVKRNEYIERPRLKFDILIANANSVADKISDDELAKTLIHFGEHGIGACRSQGYGKFDVVSVQEIEGQFDNPTGSDHPTRIHSSS